MKKKTKIFIGISAIILIVGLSTIVKITQKTQIQKDFKEKRNLISMYLQTGKDEYDLSKENTFPTEGYVLNSEKTTCKNGSIITQNPTTKKISISLSDVDECNVYFDFESSKKTLVALGETSRGVLTDFSKTAPLITNYKDDNFSGTTSSSSMTFNKNNYITYADDYVFNSNVIAYDHSSISSYTLVNPQVCQYSSCYEQLKGKYVVRFTGNTSDTVANYINVWRIYKIDDQTTLDKVYYRTSSFSLTGEYDYSTDGVYEMEDDYGTSYYYRGAVENNYVKFGKWTSNIYLGYSSETSTSYKEYYSLEECQNATSYNYNCTLAPYANKEMWWRIIRVNGDGSLRIIYDGTTGHTNGEINSDKNIGTSNWRSGRWDATYLGYMNYGTSSTSKEEAQTNSIDSLAKEYIDNWYKQNMDSTERSKYISDVLFCNDRSIPGKSITQWTVDTGLGYSYNVTGYGAMGRLLSGYNTASTWGKIDATPTFKCPQQNDAFTVDDTTKGNGDLTYPVGMITADEVVTAGSGLAEVSLNDKYYLYRSNLLTMSPYSENNRNEYMFCIANQKLGYTVGSGPAGGIAPVINLNADFVEKMIGTGTIDDPFRLSE